jgi:iron donor protein CyaY
MDEQEFRRVADRDIAALYQSLIAAEDSADIEVEESGGAIKIDFEDPPATFVVSPNFAVRQIWISALATSFKLEWSATESAFVLPKTGERLKTLVARLINQQLGQELVALS